MTEEEKKASRQIACKRWYDQNRDEKREYSKAYRKTEKGKAAIYRTIKKQEAKKGYGSGWDEKLKSKIRKRDGYKCRECGFSQNELGYKLSVHHIDYDKNNNIEENLISLCKTCHSQTNFSREDWTKYYKEALPF